MASKDQWHAITHNGEPGSEVPRALGYVPLGTDWVQKRISSLWIAAPDKVREIVNGTVGSVRTKTAFIMEPTGHVATADISRSGVSYTVHEAGNSRDGGYAGGGYSAHSYSGSVGMTSGGSTHESAPPASSSPTHLAPVSSGGHH